MQDEVSIQFMAPSFAARHISANNKHIFVGGIALGYLSYRDDLTFAGQYKITGATFGSGFDFAYDYQIARYIYIGAKLGVVAGTIKKITYTVNGFETTRDLAEQEYENLSRLDVSAGVRFNL